MQSVLSQFLEPWRESLNDNEQMNNNTEDAINWLKHQESVCSDAIHFA